MISISAVMKGATFRHDWKWAKQIEAKENEYKNTTRESQPADTYKCNVDAGFFGDQRETSIGMCLRDINGNFVAARTNWIPFHILPVEDKALLRALH